MRAILMLAQLNRKCKMLIDKMADVGDFIVPHDFFDCDGKAQVAPPAPVDTVNKAYGQGCNAAAHDSVEEAHNPYAEGSEEAAAWLTGFQEKRLPPLVPPTTTSKAKQKRKTGAKK